MNFNNKIDIIIPSCKTKDECINQINDINRTRKTQGDIIFTGLDKSAAINRNYGLKQANTSVVIMLDDDVTNFYQDWDWILIKPLLDFPDLYSLVTPRFVDEHGNTIGQLGDCSQKDIPPEYITIAKHTRETNLNIIGSTCIAFDKSTNILFDENYLGATYEDADFCMQFKQKYPQKKIIINNKCKLMHLMEAKGRVINGINISNKNKLYFRKKWNILI
jgi:hypothetical protein